MITSLVSRVLNGEERHISDQATGLKVVRVRDHLFVYRHGELKIWIDLELQYLVSWEVCSQPEVDAFNRVLQLANVSDFYTFIRHGRLVLVQAGQSFYRSEEYAAKFGPDSGNYSYAGPRHNPQHLGTPGLNEA